MSRCRTRTASVARRLRPERGGLGRLAGAGALAVLLGACEGTVADALPQWTVVLGTDAPVPQLGDRLLVEILDAEGEPACGGCRRQLGVGDMQGWPLSFGVVPPEGPTSLRVRARLYRSQDTGYDGLPGSDRLIDALGVLPVPSGPVRVAVALRMACFGVVADVAGRRSCDAATGELGPEPDLPIVVDDSSLPAPGSWGPAQPVRCRADVPAGMGCLPGGAFLLGSPESTFGPTALQPRPEQLVQLSPFALDLDEVTIGQVRQLVLAGLVGPPVSQSPDPTSLAAMCQYLGPNDASNDAMAANCVSYALGSQICAAFGKRLPTEAEWEYAAGNVSRESRYPWGGSEDACSMAIVARGRIDAPSDVSSCRATDGQTVPPGPVAGGHPLDVTELGIRNLGGNVDEWVADRFAPYGTACWDPAVLALDPRCDQGSAGQHGIRGGSWQSFPFNARAFVRNASVGDGPAASTGLRCAVSM
jgi:sulfatase modifying factor 1